jgi:hypothetical protein
MSLAAGASPGRGHVVESLIESHAIIGIEQLLNARPGSGACRACREGYPNLALGNDSTDDGFGRDIQVAGFPRLDLQARFDCLLRPTVGMGLTPGWWRPAPRSLGSRRRKYE